MTHSVDWTVGPEDTDVTIEFRMLNPSYPGHFNPVTGDGEPPSGAELEWLSAHRIDTGEDIGKDHPLFKAINDAWDDDNCGLYQKAAEIAENVQ